MKRKVALLMTGLLSLGALVSEACSVAFYTTGSCVEKKMRLTGRTTDLTTEFLTMDNSFNIYPRDVERDGNTIAKTLTNPAKWTSKYGSLVADKFGEGINEKGLCVHLLYLDKTLYANPSDTVPCVSILKTLQYLLDNATTVEECLDLIGQVRVVDEKMSGRTLPAHLAIRDARDDAAMVEFVNGGTKKAPVSVTMIYHNDAEQKYDVLTNEPPLNKQLKYYKRFAKGTKAIPGDFNAMDRFVRLKTYKKTLTVGATDWDMVANVFSLMATAHCPPGAVDYSGKEPKDELQWPTIWTSVIDLDNMIYYLKLTKCPNTIWVDLTKIDFDTLTQTGSLNTKDVSLVGEVNDQFTWE